MISYAQWCEAFPEAAATLHYMIEPATAESSKGGSSEAATQQRARMDIAQQGAMAWRNNVGATKAEELHVCPSCHFRFNVYQQPVRYGLANDSAKLNKSVKSSDLILAIPRVITPAMVGSTIAQFGSVECKAQGWTFNPKDAHESAQAKWLHIIQKLGGYGAFSTGAVKL